MSSCDSVHPTVTLAKIFLSTLEQMWPAPVVINLRALCKLCDVCRITDSATPKTCQQSTCRGFGDLAYTETWRKIDMKGTWDSGTPNPFFFWLMSAKIQNDLFTMRAHTHARTHTHTHARAHAHTHAHTPKLHDDHISQKLWVTTWFTSFRCRCAVLQIT